MVVDGHDVTEVTTGGVLLDKVAHAEGDFEFPST